MTGVRIFLTTDAGSVAAQRDGELVVDGRLHPVRGGFELLLHGPGGDPADPAFDAEAAGGVLAHLAGLAGRVGGGGRWLVTRPTSASDDAATRAGLVVQRDLLQLRRPLPLEDALRAGLPRPALRPFRPGVDEEAWLAVNNRSFAHHPDQSAQTRTDLAALETEAWFDPAGFLLLDAHPGGPRAGRLDGFCWTKVHTDHQPPLGEIFVIGVDPDAHGQRLGPALTIAGLDHLAGRGLTVGMLYVDLDNTVAVTMYDRLGFTTHHRDRIYSAG